MSIYYLVLFRCGMDDLPCQLFQALDYRLARDYAESLTEPPENVRQVMSSDASIYCAVGIVTFTDGIPTNYEHVKCVDE